jgi:hypothetical protein
LLTFEKYNKIGQYNYIILYYILSTLYIQHNMSLTAFKNKSIIQYGTKRSGIPPGGVWLPQGPFGHATSVLKKATQSYGAVGFSINGGHRNIGRVGQDMKMSQSGTPFRARTSALRP